MDPVLHAAHTFLAEVDAFWRKHPGRVQPLVGAASDRADMVKALRLGELAPENRRPLFLYEAPFENESLYLRGLVDVIARDYEALRKGIAEEGVEIPAFMLSSLAVSPVERAALAIEAAGALVGERFDGGTLALLPVQIADERGWQELVYELDTQPWSPRVRVAVHAPPGGSLDFVLEEQGARFAVDYSRLLDFLKELGSGSAGPGAGDAEPEAPPAAGAARRLRGLLLDGAAHTAVGRHMGAVASYEEAAAVCVAEKLTGDEATVRMALGGAYMAAHVPELAVESYCKAAGLASAVEAWPLCCLAWLGAGGMYLALGKDEPAATTYEAAADAATKGELAVLRDEALRLRGECLRRLGRAEEVDRVPARPSLGKGFDAAAMDG